MTLRFARGRPRTRPPVRRMTVELDDALVAAVEVAAGASPFRVIVEEGLRLWLQRQPQLSGAEQRLSDHAKLSPPTPSAAPQGRIKER
jgi:hypothetical protein